MSLRVDISKLTYLALGDSYTSGEGDLEKDANGITHYLPLTDIGSDTCHISSRSYPFLLRDAWGVEPKNMHSVACSGSWLIKDYMADPQTYLGQGDRLSTHEDDLDTVRQTALEKYIPGRVPQIEFVKNTNRTSSLLLGW